jgi:hypothetical protein
MWLQPLYVLFFIELGSRHVHLAGCSAHPSSGWVTQQARQLTRTWPAGEKPIRFLIRDRDQKCAGGFDAVFRSDNIEVIARRFVSHRPTAWRSGSCGPSDWNASTGS